MNKYLSLTITIFLLGKAHAATSNTGHPIFDNVAIKLGKGAEGYSASNDRNFQKPLTYIPSGIPYAFEANFSNVDSFLNRMKAIGVGGDVLDFYLNKTENHKKFAAMMILTKAYFGNSFDIGYVSSFPNALENAEAIKRAALETGFAYFGIPLDQYKMYGREDFKDSVLKSSRRLVLGCGNLIANVYENYHPPRGNTVVPSSGFNCTHHEHNDLTVSLAPEYLPTVAADARDPNFIGALPKNYYDVIVDEEELIRTKKYVEDEDEQELISRSELYKKTLRPGGRLIQHVYIDYTDQDGKFHHSTPFKTIYRKPGGCDFRLESWDAEFAKVEGLGDFEKGAGCWAPGRSNDAAAQSKQVILTTKEPLSGRFTLEIEATRHINQNTTVQVGSKQYVVNLPDGGTYSSAPIVSVAVDLGEEQTNKIIIDVPNNHVHEGKKLGILFHAIRILKD